MANGSKDGSFYNISVWDQFAYLIPGAVSLIVTGLMCGILRQLYDLRKIGLLIEKGFWEQLLDYCDIAVLIVKNTIANILSRGSLGNGLLVLVIFVILAYSAGVIIEKLRRIIPLWKLRHFFIGESEVELIRQERKEWPFNKFRLRHVYFSPTIRAELVRRIFIINKVDPSKEDELPIVEQIKFANKYFKKRFATLNPSFFASRNRSSDRPQFSRQLAFAIFVPLMLAFLVGYIGFHIPYSELLLLRVLYTLVTNFWT